jgi:hypothetical protein
MQINASANETYPKNYFKLAKNGANPSRVSPKTLPNKKITTKNHLGDEFHHHNVLDKFKQFKSERRERVGLDFT